MTAGIGRLSGFVKLNILKSADRMSEENYAFRPSPEVRSFGEMLGHIANSNYSFCSQASATANPSKTNVEKTVTAKADLVLALQNLITYLRIKGLMPPSSDPK